MGISTLQIAFIVFDLCAEIKFARGNPYHIPNTMNCIFGLIITLKELLNYTKIIIILHIIVFNFRCVDSVVM